MNQKYTESEEECPIYSDETTQMNQFADIVVPL